MFDKRNCVSWCIWRVCFCSLNLPVTDCLERERLTSKSSISIWFSVNTYYLGGVSLIQYYVVFFCLVFRLYLLTYYEFGLTEYHCMSLILGIKRKYDASVILVNVSKWSEGNYWVMHEGVNSHMMQLSTTANSLVKVSSTEDTCLLSHSTQHKCSDAGLFG